MGALDNNPMRNGIPYPWWRVVPSIECQGATTAAVANLSAVNLLATFPGVVWNINDLALIKDGASRDGVEAVDNTHNGYFRLYSVAGGIGVFVRDLEPLMAAELHQCSLATIRQGVLAPSMWAANVPTPYVPDVDPLTWNVVFMGGLPPGVPLAVTQRKVPAAPAPAVYVAGITVLQTYTLPVNCRHFVLSWWTLPQTVGLVNPGIRLSFQNGGGIITQVIRYNMFLGGPLTEPRDAVDYTRDNEALIEVEFIVNNTAGGPSPLTALGAFQVHGEAVV